MNKNFLIALVLLIAQSPQMFATQPGALDTTFNAGGIQPGTVSTEIALTGTDNVGKGVAIQADGKIVVAGYTMLGGTNQFAVARFNVNGTLDATFNPSGAQPGTQTAIIDGGTNNQGNAVAIQSDGKIVVAGRSFVGITTHFAVARFNTDGSLDTTFAGDGTTSTTIDGGTGNSANGVTIQTDGKIVLAGQTNVGGQIRFGLARFNPNGTLDTTFAGDGTTSTTVDNLPAVALSVALQSDGKIIAGGATIAVGPSYIAAVRFNTDGSLDTTFNPAPAPQPGTKTITIDNLSFDNTAFSALIQTDGKIILAGYTDTTGAGSRKFAVARLLTNGDLDVTFNPAGVQPGTASTTTNNNTVDNEALSAALQTNGKIVLAGYTYDGTTFSFGLARFNTNGLLDTTFNPSGVQPGTVSTIIDNNLGGDNEAQSVAIQADGKIVAAGFRNNGNTTNFAVARFFGDIATNACALRFIEKYGARLNS